jgi:hypothetical protein
VVKVGGIVVTDDVVRRVFSGEGVESKHEINVSRRGGEMW